MIAFKSIKPATKFKSSVFRDKLRAAADAYGDAIQQDFEKTTATWKNKPTFQKTVRVGNAAGGALAKRVTGSASGISVEVSTDDPVFGFVDEGTKPHKILPRRKKVLMFRTGYKAKTQPNVIGSTQGGAEGETAVSQHGVNHPGTKARNFSKLLRKKHQPEFRKAMQAALDAAAKQSGHSLKG